LRSVAVGIGILALLSACDLRRPPGQERRLSKAASQTRAQGAIFHGARGELRLTLTPREDGDWEAVMPAGARLRLHTSEGELQVLDANDAVVVRLAPAPGGYQLFNVEGQVAQRVVLPEAAEARRTQLDVLSPDGIAIVRIAQDPVRGSAIGRDSAGQPFLHTRAERTGLGLFTRDGTRMGDVQHLDDPIAALLLGIETLPIAHRAALVGLRLGRAP
jgi:hypothetical protein